MSKRIFIVNSVKGGCGKSTVSLHLARYLQKGDKKLKPFIIDLDLCGSTWRSSYEYALTQGGESIRKKMENKDRLIFINDMLYNADKYINNEYYFELSYQTGSVYENQTTDGSTVESDYLRVILCDSERLTSLSDDDLELLESVVFKLVKHIWNFSYDSLKKKDDKPRNLDKGEPDKDYPDIIFDMPPGYEKHTERIIRHLIMDLSSPLNNDDKMNDYEAYLCMVSNIDEASARANERYVENLKWGNIESVVSDRIKYGFFIINDLNNKLVEVSPENRDSAANNVRDSFGKKDFKVRKVGGLETSNAELKLHHTTKSDSVETKHITNKNNNNSGTTLQISDEIIKSFDEIFKNIFYGC